MLSTSLFSCLEVQRNSERPTDLLDFLTVAGDCITPEARLNPLKITAIALTLLGAIGLAITLAGMIAAYRIAQVQQPSPDQLANGISSSLVWSMIGAPLFVVGATLLLVSWCRGRRQIGP